MAHLQRQHFRLQLAVKVIAVVAEVRRDEVDEVAAHVDCGHDRRSEFALRRRKLQVLGRHDRVLRQNQVSKISVCEITVVTTGKYT